MRIIAAAATTTGADAAAASAIVYIQVCVYTTIAAAAAATAATAADVGDVRQRRIPCSKEIQCNRSSCVKQKKNEKKNEPHHMISKQQNVDYGKGEEGCETKKKSKKKSNPAI